MIWSLSNQTNLESSRALTLVDTNTEEKGPLDWRTKEEIPFGVGGAKVDKDIDTFGAAVVVVAELASAFIHLREALEKILSLKRGLYSAPLSSPQLKRWRP